MPNTKIKNEKEFGEKLVQKLARKLPKKYITNTKKNLFYNLEIDPSGNLLPEDTKVPKRGQFAFQIDVLIGIRKFRALVPLVAMELKYDDYTTHDLITYSSKASRHKAIYPYLRYGFLVLGKRETLTRKFLTHNEGIDFAMAFTSLRAREKELIKMIQDQIKIAERMIEILEKNRPEFCRYEKTIKIYE